MSSVRNASSIATTAVVVGALTSSAPAQFTNGSVNHAVQVSGAYDGFGQGFDSFNASNMGGFGDFGSDSTSISGSVFPDTAPWLANAEASVTSSLTEFAFTSFASLSANAALVNPVEDSGGAFGTVSMLFFFNLADEAELSLAGSIWTNIPVPSAASVALFFEGGIQLYSSQGEESFFFNAVLPAGGYLLLVEVSVEASAGAFQGVESQSGSAGYSLQAVLVPTPGALALLGMASAIATGRRRRPH